MTGTLQQETGHIRLRWKVLIIAVLLAAMLCLFVPVIKSVYRAAALVIIHMKKPPALALALLQKPVISEEVTIPTPAGPLSGILYTPVQSRPAPGMVLVPGLEPRGAKFDRVQVTASMIAATGLTVFTPNLPRLTHFLVDESSVTNIGETAKWLAARTSGPVTVVGISFSGGLTLVAAVDPRYSSYFRQVVSMSGYADLRHLEEFYLTGKEPLPDGTYATYKNVEQFGTMALALQYLKDRVPEEDIPFLEESVATWMRGQRDRALLLRDATPRQAEEFDEIVSCSPESIDKTRVVLNKNLPTIISLSPHGQMTSLKAPVTLIHGADDIVVPAGEAMWLSQEIPNLAEVRITGAVGHAYLARNNAMSFVQKIRNAWEELVLARAVVQVFRLADPSWF